MSTVKVLNCQIGQSLTATNNFCWYQPSSPDGTVRLGNGNAGATTLDTITVNSSGNVGIGTSSPADSSARLTVSGTSTVFLDASGSLLRFNKTAGTDTGWLSNRSYSWFDGNGLALSTQTADPLRFGTNSTERMRLDSSGNLGLGVTPSGWGNGFRALQIGSGASVVCDGSATVRLYANAYYDGTNLKYINSAQASQYRQFNGQHDWWIAGSGSAGGTISFTQAMTLDASGTLLIGQTTNPATSSVALKVPTGTGNGVNAQITSNTGTSYPWSNYNASGTYVGGISCTSSATAFPTSSDERLKENVQDASDTLNALLAVKIRSFDWKIDGAHQEYGVVAQEIQPHMPEAVLVSPGEGDYLSVDYTKIVPRLVKAIQELSAELNELKGKIV